MLGPYSSSPLPTSFSTTSPIQQPVIQSAPNSPPVDHSSPSLATTSLPFTPSHPPSAEHHLPSSSSLHSSPLPTSSDFVVSASSPPSDQPTTSTIHVPLPHTTNSHSMVTRSKSGIVKKKVIFSTKHPILFPSNSSYDTVEPTSYTEPAKSIEWRQAMAEEFSALQ